MFTSVAPSTSIDVMRGTTTGSGMSFFMHPPAKAASSRYMVNLFMPVFVRLQVYGHAYVYVEHIEFELGLRVIARADHLARLYVFGVVERYAAYSH